jgi:hypothetical protein
LLDRVDFLVGDGRQLRPAALEDAHDAARFEDFDVALLLHRVTQEQVAGKHRNRNDVALAVPARARAHFRQEGREAFRGKLLRDEPLAVAARPDRVPR